MSTIYTFHQECPTVTTAAETDYVLLYNYASTATSKITARNLGITQGSAVGVVDTTATTLTITAASHAGKIVTISSASPVAITLPQATGTGNRYRFNVRVAATATSSSIKVANATDVISGIVYALTTSSDNVIGYKTSATSDTIYLNGTTLGGVVGDFWEIVDIKTGFFQVLGSTAPTGSTATPFAAAV